MELDDLQAAYEAFTLARGKFDDQANAMKRGYSDDFQLLMLLLDELNQAQHRFSTAAAKIVEGEKESCHLRLCWGVD